MLKQTAYGMTDGAGIRSRPEVGWMMSGLGATVRDGPPHSELICRGQEPEEQRNMVRHAIDIRKITYSLESVSKTTSTVFRI